MSQQITHFEDIDISDLEEYYDTEIPFNDSTITLDLNFEETKIDKATVKSINQFITKLQSLNTANLKAIREDFASGDTVETYITHHLEDLEETDLAEIIDLSHDALSREEKLLAAIHLSRVGIYPENEDYFAVFDYTIGTDFTQYLIVVFVKEDGSLDYMTMES